MELLTLDTEFLLPNINNNAFLEYCNDLDSLGIIADPELYLEAVNIEHKGFKNNLGTIIRNTKDTTKQANGLYNSLTNIGGRGYKSIWDVAISAIKLIAKIVGYIFYKIFMIPELITGVINMVSNIPSNIKNRIKGNIYLYITAKDLSFFYNNIYPHIRNFLYNASKFSEGDSWNTLFTALKDKRKLISIVFNKSDLKYMDLMIKDYNNLQMIEFTKSLIDMSDKTSIDIYFGTSNKLIEFVDIHGYKHKTNYYDGLISLVKEISTYKSQMESVRDNIGKKIQDTELNSSFNELSPGVQKRIINTIMMTSKVINIIGNLVRYVLIDMKTIEKNTAKLIKKEKIKSGNPNINNIEGIDTKHIQKKNKNV